MLVENMRKHLNIIVENSEPVQQSEPQIDSKTLNAGIQSLETMLSRVEAATDQLATSARAPTKNVSSSDNQQMEEGVAGTLKGMIGAMAAALSMGVAANPNIEGAKYLGHCAAWYQAGALGADVGTNNYNSKVLSDFAQLTKEIGNGINSTAFSAGYNSADDNIYMLLQQVSRNPSEINQRTYRNVLTQNIEQCNKFMDIMIASAKQAAKERDAAKQSKQSSASQATGVQSRPQATTQQQSTSLGGAHYGKITGTGRAFFHSSPNSQSKTDNLFLIPGDDVTVYEIKNGFAYVMYFRKNGSSVDGYIPADRVQISGKQIK